MGKGAPSAAENTKTGPPSAWPFATRIIFPKDVSDRSGCPRQNHDSCTRATAVDSTNSTKVPLIKTRATPERRADGGPGNPQASRPTSSTARANGG